MSRATPQMRNLAKRLISYETGGNNSSATKTPAAFPVIEKLRPQLTTLIGNTGVYALHLRALTVTREEVSALHAVQVKADGSLETSDEAEMQSDPGELAKGNVVLVAQLLGLLTAFIGEKLTLRLVGEVWPKLSLDNADLGKGG